MQAFSTKAIHAGTLKKDSHGSLRIPVYDSAAFEFDSCESLEKACRGKQTAHVYSRMSNPSVEDFEQRIKTLTGARGVIAVSSGMAAIADTLIALAEGGSGVPVIVDGTLTTPYIFPTREFGVAIEVLSSTKYIAGGATSIGGLIIDNGICDWSQTPKLKDHARRFGSMAFISKLRREVFRNLGACLSPHNIEDAADLLSDVKQSLEAL